MGQQTHLAWPLPGNKCQSQYSIIKSHFSTHLFQKIETNRRRSTFYTNVEVNCKTLTRQKIDLFMIEIHSLILLIFKML